MGLTPSVVTGPGEPVDEHTIVAPDTLAVKRPFPVALAPADLVAPSRG